jgi:hypothetical protein
MKKTIKGRKLNMPSTPFSVWYDKWEKLASFEGPKLPGEEDRIRAVVDLWSEELPPGDGWKRIFKRGDFNNLPKLCEHSVIYRRCDREYPPKGSEHEIERDIIDKNERIVFFKREYWFKPIVNAFPCAKDSGGGRLANVEFDLLGIFKKGSGAIHPLICEIKTGKNGSKYPWYAAIENLRQLKLFIGNLKDNLKFIKTKSEDPNMGPFAAPVGIVIAEQDYYKYRGQKFNSMEPTRKLLGCLQDTPRCKEARVVLATWDKKNNRIDRVGGWELDGAFSP